MVDELEKYYIRRQPPYNNTTLGELTDDNDIHLCYTLELAWNNNEPETSCIPPGVYTCIPHNSAKFPNTWEVSGVPGRAAILFHSGNTSRDTRGCVVFGNTKGTIGDKPAVLNSVATLNMLRNELPKTFQLTIT